jgi:RNA polymerase sigma-70 factor (ECF subfamily)
MSTHTGVFSRLVRLTTAADFEAVYEAELPRIFNFFRYRIGDDQVAEDLTAETFEKAWRYRQKYRKDLASFTTWLFTLARHVATDYYRKRRTAIPLEEAAEVPDPQVVEDVAQEQADFARLGVLLSRLAERERELVALKYGAGLTNRTIARLTGLSETNVSTILFRVTELLRVQWEVGHER